MGPHKTAVNDVRSSCGTRKVELYLFVKPWIYYNRNRYNRVRHFITKFYLRSFVHWIEWIICVSLELRDLKRGPENCFCFSWFSIWNAKAAEMFRTYREDYRSLDIYAIRMKIIICLRYLSCHVAESSFQLLIGRHFYIVIK